MNIPMVTTGITMMAVGLTKMNDWVNANAPWLPWLFLAVGAGLTLVGIFWSRLKNLTCVRIKRQGNRLVVYKSAIHQALEIEVNEVTTTRKREETRFLVEAALTFKVKRIPMNIAKLQLCAMAEPLDPITPALPIRLEKKMETHIVRYEIPYYAPALGNVTFGQCNVYLCALAEGKDWISKEFAIPSPIN